MVAYDPDSNKLVVRIVFDGPSGAGKTTNLLQLCQFFSLQRRSDLFLGHREEGRTQYLDWLQLEAGVVCGYPVRCHLLTVPGHPDLSRRRQFLLSLADAVVFVTEATPEGLAAARPLWTNLLAASPESTEERPTLVVQSNKADLPSAVPEATLREQWGIAPNIPVVSARARDGQGVRETVVVVIRAITEDIQRQILERGVSAFVRHYEDGASLEQRLQLMEAALLLPSGKGQATKARRGPAEKQSLLTTAAPGDVDAPTSIGQRPAIYSISTAPAPSPDSVTSTSEQPEPMDGPAPNETAQGTATAAIPSANPTTAARAVPQASTPASIKQTMPSSVALPPLPTADVARELIWPEGTGRDLIARVPLAEAQWRNDLTGSHHLKDGSGKASTIIVEALNWCLKTTERRRFERLEQAQAALQTLAQKKEFLGDLCPPRTVLAIKQDSQGGYWLWTVCLWLTTLRAQLTHAIESHNDKLLAATLTSYSQATVRSLDLCASRNLVLDVHPNNFGVVGSAIYYIDDDIATGALNTLIGPAILRRFDEYSAHTTALEVYSEALIKDFSRAFTPETIAKLDLTEALETTHVRTEVAKQAKQKLLSSLGRRQKK